MKVLVLSPPLGSAGGIQRYTMTLIRALKELLGQSSVRLVAIRATEGRAGRPRSQARKLWFGLRALGEVARWRPDLIICTHLALGPVGWLVATAGERPYWIVTYGIEAWGTLPYAKRTTLQHADRVVVISDFSREWVMKRHGIDRERVASLPCALDEALCSGDLRSPNPWSKGAERFPHPQPFSPEGAMGEDYFAGDRGAETATTANRRSETAATIPDGRRVLLTVGRMAAAERYKGHDVVLRALPSVMAKIPNLTYAVAGEGDDRARLEALAQELGLNGGVVFTGEVSDDELAAMYRRSEVFVLPARTVIDDHDPKGEGFGIVYLEAMAFGKPVIGPNCGAPAELLRQGENGLLVDPDDPAAVAEAIIRLLSDPEAARRMGEAGRELVMKHYSHDVFRARLGEMLGGRERSVAGSRWATGEPSAANREQASPLTASDEPAIECAVSAGERSELSRQ